MVLDKVIWTVPIDDAKMRVRSLLNELPRPTEVIDGNDEKTQTLRSISWIVPLSVFYVTFLIIPLLSIFILSFFTWTSIEDFRFVGLSNYQWILTNSTFYIVLRNTFAYTVSNTVLTVGGGLVLALLIQHSVRYIRSFLRVVFLLPFAIMSAGVGLLWALMYDYQYGVINQLLALIGTDIQPLWLGSSTWALPGIILTSVWWTIGFYTIIWLVGLQSINRTYYEAAKVDGANAIQRFYYITLPLLKPISLFLIVISLLVALREFALIWIMTRGGPGNSSEVLVTWMYKLAFTQNNLGLGAALAVIIFVISAVLSLTIIRSFGVLEDAV